MVLDHDEHDRFGAFLRNPENTKTHERQQEAQRAREQARFQNFTKSTQSKFELNFTQRLLSFLQTAVKRGNTCAGLCHIIVKVMDFDTDQSPKMI
jgi:hypothetical protein